MVGDEVKIRKGTGKGGKKWHARALRRFVRIFAEITFGGFVPVATASERVDGALVAADSRRIRIKCPTAALIWG
jgi:hypothetical protein